MAERNGADAVEQLRGDVAALQEQLSELMKMAAKTGHDGAKAAREHAASVVETARDAASLYGRQGYDAVNDVVQRHPLASLAGAALFGAVMARLLQSGRR
jgi:ElaB/YqjD/DUF883 family membrane-anchored ribosome-binding protein